MSPNISLQRKFVSPEIIFGAGCRHSVGTCAGNFGARKVLVVSDPGVVKAGWWPMCRPASLDRASSTACSLTFRPIRAAKR